MKVEILGTPFNGLGELPDIENPAEGLRQAKLVHLLKANGHNVTDLGDLSGFLCQEIRDPETGINDFDLWLDLSREISQFLGKMLDRQATFLKKSFRYGFILTLMLSIRNSCRLCSRSQVG